MISPAKQFDRLLVRRRVLAGWVVLSALAVWCIGLTPPGVLLREWVARGTDFKVRELLFPSSLDPRIKIFAFDDATVARLHGTDIMLKDWGNLLASIASRKPAAILIDKLFDRHYAPDEVREFVAKLKTLETPVSIISFASLDAIPGREELRVPSQNVVPTVLQRSTTATRHLYGADQTIVDATKVGHTVYEGGGLATLYFKAGGSDVFHWAITAADSASFKEGDLFVNGRRVPADSANRLLINTHSRQFYGSSTFSFFPLVAGAVNGVPPTNVNAGDYVVILPAMFTGSTDWTTTVVGELPGGYLMVSMLDSVLTGRWLRNIDDTLLAIALFSALGALTSTVLPYGRILPFAGLFNVLLVVGGISVFCAAGISTPWSSWVLAWDLPCFGLLVARYQAIKIESARMSSELLAARLVQSAFLPRNVAPKRLSVVPFYRPSAECGGDWWWFKSTTDTDHFFVLADVTGHGVAAALVTSSTFAAVESLFDNWATQGAVPIPEKILSQVDLILSKTHDRLSTLTMVAGHIDLESRLVHFAFGGHPGGFIVSTSGDVKRIGGVGDMIGMGTPVEFATVTAPVRSGDCIFLYTDGLTDNKNSDGNAWHRKVLFDFLKANAGLGAENLVKSLVKTYEAHLGDASADDDVTILAIEISADSAES